MISNLTNSMQFNKQKDSARHWFAIEERKSLHQSWCPLLGKTSSTEAGCSKNFVISDLCQMGFHHKCSYIIAVFCFTNAEKYVKFKVKSCKKFILE